MRNPAYHYGRWGGMVAPPARMQARRPIMTALKQMFGYATGSTSASPFHCWGPAWDRTCKVCAPLPNGGETCSSFKVNDVQGAPTERIGFVYGRPR